MKSLWVCEKVAQIITMNHLHRNGLSVLTDSKDLERWIPPGFSKKLRQGSQWRLGFGRVANSPMCWLGKKLSPQQPVSLETIIFFNPCVFEGKLNRSASDSFTLNSSKSCFALCYFMASKLEFNLEIACGPGKGPTPRRETQTQILFWLQRIRGYFFG